MNKEKNMSHTIQLRTIQTADLEELWQVSFGPKADLEWMKYNGPYFNDPILNWEDFSNGFGKSFVKDPLIKAIVKDDKIIGLVTAYWEDGDLKQWLEVGMLIYDASLWGQGIGTTVLSEWLHYLFDLFDYLPHIGFTTWSGNKGMQILGEKCHMKKEGIIRKVRYLNGVYYDSVKYGILREELPE